MTITLAELLKDSAYKLNQFKPEQVKALEAGITLKESGKKEAPYITCPVRGKSPNAPLKSPSKIRNLRPWLIWRR